MAGEAGLGKSSLLTEFARRSTGRARVLWGACDPLVTPRALGPLHDIGRQTGGPLAARLGGAAAQEEIFAAFLDEMAGPHQRLRPVVVVEDAAHALETSRVSRDRLVGDRRASTEEREQREGQGRESFHHARAYFVTVPGVP